MNLLFDSLSRIWYICVWVVIREEGSEYSMKFHISRQNYESIDTDIYEIRVFKRTHLRSELLANNT